MVSSSPSFDRTKPAEELRILLATVPAVLTGRGAYVNSRTASTMPRWCSVASMRRVPNRMANTATPRIAKFIAWKSVSDTPKRRTLWKYAAATWFAPPASMATASAVQIVGYNNATDRRNLLNETEVTYPLVAGGISQTLLGGVAIGRQITDNMRNTGYFHDSATTITAPLSDPIVAVPVTFRQSATDADNHSTATSISLYGQSQIYLSRHWQAIVGARYEHFDVDFQNARTNESLSRSDDLVSPRAGLLFKPVEQ